VIILPTRGFISDLHVKSSTDTINDI